MQGNGTKVNQSWRSQATHETQVTHGREGDLYLHYATCQKNPGHSNYKTLDNFDMNCFPSRYQDNDLVNCIVALYCLTVRVAVNRTSSERPDVYKGTIFAYPFSETKGSNVMRVGSGWLRSVRLFCKVASHDTNQTEQKGNCVLSTTEGAEFVIRTAAHLVFNDEEGTHTVCHFFFDKGGQPEDCKGAVKVEGAIRVVSDIDGDWSDMTFFTHDKSFAEKLSQMVDEYPKLHQKIWDKYPTDTNSGRSQSDPDLNLSVIVSHPHGCHKHITVGVFQERDVEASLYSRYTYTTPTCNGSSGAPVFILGNSRRLPWCSHPHSGTCQQLGNINYSGVGFN